MQNKRFGAFSSSANPEKLALTWKGALIGLIPLVIAIAAALGVNIAEADLTQGVEAITSIVAGATVVFGLARKIYFAVVSRG